MSLENKSNDYFDLSKIPGPPKLSKEEESALIEEISAKIRSVNATIVAHYYTDSIVQELAENCGGFVGDSLEMAKFGAKTDAATIIVAGVRFMGETAKILSPEKKVYMPTLNATCSLDLGCPVDEFTAFINEHKDRTVVVYANTSAAVKARSDWVVTSSIAVDVVSHLAAQGKKILWAPDRYLGDYIKEKTGADMLLWKGSCVVHEEFKAKELKEMMKRFPDAGVLVHPESPASVIRLADAVGSTTQLIKAAATMENRQFIVATDRGIFYKMKQAAPYKTFIEAPTAGEGATCQSCAHCPWMAMNHLPNLRSVLDALEKGKSGADLSEFEITVSPELAEKAMVPLNRMVNFAAKK